MGKEDSAVAFYGLGAHFGTAVSQNGKGHVLGHVKDLSLDPTSPERRIYQTNERQRMHTDSCDIVGLLCLQPAKSGGSSSLCSSATVYNTMIDRAPHLAALLTQDLFWDRKGEVPAGKKGWYAGPVFNFTDGCLNVIYDRNFFTTTKRFFPEVPLLTADQVAALDLFEEIAESEEVKLDMMLEKGDMQFIHNHQILHARGAFEDEPARRRHLLRLWLSVENGRELPPSFAERYGNIKRGTVRGGIVVPGMKLCAPIDV
eukprot:TRINITY_DN4069_c0_g1_i3.p1 TRINITY_DN4069_c0_g1~~TRINITY_DN4069_c0_g1_i3.p1  ORF type:complete len:258 (+),score=42.15 TRINITY_DN4069_c0_g1_i3:313-1086(+)